MGMEKKERGQSTHSNKKESQRTQTQNIKIIPQACVEVLIKKKCLLAFLKLDPDTMTMESGFSRDVRKIGHYGTGEVELQFARAKTSKKPSPCFKKATIQVDPTPW